MENRQDKPTRDWGQVILDVCLLGKRAVTGEIPDNAADKQKREAEERLVQAFKSVRLDDLTKNLTALMEEGNVDVVSDLSGRLEDVVQEWEDEQPANYMLHSWMMRDLLTETANKPSETTISDVIRDNGGLGLRADVITAAATEPWFSMLRPIPAFCFVAGLVRLLEDWEAARSHLATRPVATEESMLLDIFDPRQLRARLAHEEALVSAQGLPDKVDRHLSLIQAPLRGPARLSPYLSLLTTCYTDDHKEVCVILCRCLLEDALKLAFELRNVDRGVKDMAAMIRFASEQRWITKKQAALAHDVRMRGNKVLHEGQSDLVKDVRGTIESTLETTRTLIADG